MMELIHLINQHYLLSIYIPTYNRQEILLNNLKKTIQFQSNKVEIVVSDNSDSDILGKQLTKLYQSRVNYFWNRGNVGYDQNVIKCFTRSNGKFILFLSDEDEINKEYFDSFVSNLEKLGNYSLILTHVMDKRTEEKTIYYKYEKNVYKRGDDALKHLFLRFTYLSGLVIQKSLIVPLDYNKFIGSQYMQLYLVGLGCISSDVYCEQRPIIFMNKQEKSITFFSDQVKNKNRINRLPYYHPFSRITQLQYLIRMVDVICKNRNYLIQFFLRHLRGNIINYFRLGLRNLKLDFREKTAIISYSLVVLACKFRKFTFHYEFLYFLIVGIINEISDKFPQIWSKIKKKLL